MFDIKYNHLNLPVEINFDEHTVIPSILYKYDATGTKMEKSVKDGTTITTQYSVGFIYNNNGGDQKLQFFSHPEGYVEPVGGTERSVKGFEIGQSGPTYSSYNYIFQYKDHLGNVRLSYSDSDLNGAISPDEIIEESNYYPYGLEHKGYNNVVSSNGNSLAQKYKTYQGQEITDELELNLLEFKWRMHDPAIGRFIQIDPLAEKYVYNSTYAFSENRVIDGVELEGLEYVNANLARLTIRNDGSVNLNMQRMTNPNKNGFNWINSNPANWSGNNMGAGYLNTKVGEFSFGSIQSKYSTLGGLRSQRSEIISSNAEKTGQTYNQNRNYIGNGSVIGGGEARAAKAMLAIEGVRIGFQMLFIGFNKYDEFKTNEQLKLLGLAANDLTRALLNGGIIPEENLNIEDLSTILQVIYSGENSSGNKNLTTLGLHIYNSYNRDIVSDEEAEHWRKESERDKKRMGL